MMNTSSLTIGAATRCQFVSLPRVILMLLCLLVMSEHMTASIACRADLSSNGNFEVGVGPGESLLTRCACEK